MRRTVTWTVSRNVALDAFPRAKVLKGELKSRVYRMSHRRGKKTGIRRVLTVIEVEHQYYVVVLDEVKDI